LATAPKMKASTKAATIVEIRDVSCVMRKVLSGA
jgi:hypothetical protein